MKEKFQQSFDTDPIPEHEWAVTKVCQPNKLLYLTS